MPKVLKFRQIFAVRNKNSICRVPAPLHHVFDDVLLASSSSLYYITVTDPVSVEWDVSNLECGLVQPTSPHGFGSVIVPLGLLELNSDLLETRSPLGVDRTHLISCRFTNSSVVRAHFRRLQVRQVFCAFARVLLPPLDFGMA